VWGSRWWEDAGKLPVCSAHCFFFIVVLGRGTLCHLQRFCKCINYFILEFTPSTTHLCPPSPQISGLVSTGTIFSLTCMCTHFSHHIHPPIPFPGHILPTHLYQPCPLGRISSSLLFSNFAEEKKIKRNTWHFCLIEIKGVCMGYYHVCMCYTPNCFISSNYLYSTLLPFLCVFRHFKISKFILVYSVYQHCSSS
jgi:hypothetical protein